MQLARGVHTLISVSPGSTSTVRRVSNQNFLALVMGEAHAGTCPPIELIALY